MGLEFVKKLTELQGLGLGEGLNSFPNVVVWFDLWVNYNTMTLFK